MCVCVHKQKRINNDWTLHDKLGHHTFIRYLGSTNLVTPYLHQWYELCSVSVMSGSGSGSVGVEGRLQEEHIYNHLS